MNEVKMNEVQILHRVISEYQAKIDDQNDFKNYLYKKIEDREDDIRRLSSDIEKLNKEIVFLGGAS